MGFSFLKEEKEEVWEDNHADYKQNFRKQLSHTPWATSLLPFQGVWGNPCLILLPLQGVWGNRTLLIAVALKKPDSRHKLKFCL